MKRVINEEQNKWKIVLVKTIDNVEPIYYRVVNLHTYDIKTIPAYRIFDAVFNDGMNIINLKCENNKASIVDSMGYVSTDEVLVIDEFDTEVPNIYDWCLENSGIGDFIIGRFNSEKNTFSPESYAINSEEKIAWTCKNGHTIKCGFPSYVSTMGSCPICELEEKGETPSLAYWASLTDNKELLNMYERATDNTDLSTKINYKTKKKIWLKDSETDEVVLESLYDITVDGKKPSFKNKASTVNIKRNK
jgi:hypothetical protein